MRQIEAERIMGALGIVEDDIVTKVLSFLHLCGAITIGLLILAHLAGVVHHVFIRRDGLLRRML